MQIRRSLPFFSPNPSIRQYFCSNLTPQPHPETEVQKFKGKLVKVNAIVNFAQIVKTETNMFDDYNTAQKIFQ